MPRLRRHTAAARQGIPTSRRATPGAFGADIAAATAQLGQATSQLSQQLVAAEERRDKLTAQRDAAVLREQAIRHLDELRQKGEPVAEPFQEYLDAQLQDLRDRRSTREGLSWADRQAANIMADLGAAARTADAQLIGQQAQEAAKAIQQSDGVFLQTAPEVLPEITAENREFVEALEIPDNLKPAVLREMDASAARNAVRGWIKADPNLAKEMIEAGRFDAYLDPDDRQALMGHANTRIRSLEQAARIEKAEQARQRSIESAQLMNDALVRVHSEDPNEHLTAGDVAALAEQTFPDGTPKLQPAQVNQLFNLTQRVAEDGPVSSDPRTVIDYVARLDTLSERELIEAASEGRLSLADYKSMMNTVKSGDTALRRARTASLKNLPSFMDMYDFELQFNKDYGRIVSQATILTQEREQEYRDAGKNPMDYYRDGTFAADVRQLASTIDPLQASNTIGDRIATLAEGRKPDPSGRYRIGDVLEGYVYIGGPLRDMENSWVPLEDLEGE